MSVTRLKQRLQEARRLWEQSRNSPDAIGQAGYLPGVLQGFREAMAILRNYQQEKIKSARSTRKPLSRWNAKVLYDACRHAENRLHHSDRIGAMKILRKALSEIEEAPADPSPPE